MNNVYLKQAIITIAAVSLVSAASARSVQVRNITNSVNSGGFINRILATFGLN